MRVLALKIKVDNLTGAFRSEPSGLVLIATQCVCLWSLGPLPSPGPIILADTRTTPRCCPPDYSPSSPHLSMKHSTLSTSVKLFSPVDIFLLASLVAILKWRPHNFWIIGLFLPCPFHTSYLYTVSQKALERCPWDLTTSVLLDFNTDLPIIIFLEILPQLSEIWQPWHAFFGNPEF